MPTASTALEPLADDTSVLDACERLNVMVQRMYGIHYWGAGVSNNMHGVHVSLSRGTNPAAIEQFMKRFQAFGGTLTEDRPPTLHFNTMTTFIDAVNRVEICARPDRGLRVVSSSGRQ